MLDDKSLEFRASTKGLLIGEVVNEINNKSIILREFNIYKYNLILDTLWLLIFAVPMGFVLNNNSAIKWFNEVDFVLCVAFWLWFIFLFWPSLLFILRKIYSFLDKPHNE